MRKTVIVFEVDGTIHVSRTEDDTMTPETTKALVRHLDRNTALVRVLSDQVAPPKSPTKGASP